MQEIQRMTSRQWQDRQTNLYRPLIGFAEEVVENARRVVQNTSKTRRKDIFTDLAGAGLHEETEYYCGLGTRVVNQARRRILDGEQLVNAEKIYSIFEPTPT